MNPTQAHDDNAVTAAEPRPRFWSRRRVAALGVGIVVVSLCAGVAVAVAFKPTTHCGPGRNSDAKSIRTATELYFVNGGTGCPNVEALVLSGELKRGTATRDGWGYPYTIACDGENVTVTSPGPDGQSGTRDDIRTASGGQTL